MKKIIHIFGILFIFLLNILSVHSENISHNGQNIKQDIQSGSGEIIDIQGEPSDIQIDGNINLQKGKLQNNIFMNSINTFSDNGLISKWTFDNCNANDSIGENHGYSYGNITCQPGKNGNALKFGGVGSAGYIIVPNNTTISMIDNFTYNITFRLSSYLGMDGYGNATINGTQTLLAKGGDRSGLNIFIGTNAAPEAKIYLHSGRRNYTGGNTLYSDINLVPNQWYTISVVSGGGYIKLYLNGVLEKTMLASEFSINPNMASQPLKFGISEGNAWYPFNGLIDEVSLYNRALSSEEIGQFFGNNSTSTNTPNYIYNPIFIDQNKIYSLFDKSTNACHVNENLKQTNTTTAKADLDNAGDPVNLATGEFDYENTFLSIPGEKIPYEFTLNYKNQTYYNGPIGINWDHNYNKYLIEEDNGNILYYNGKLGVFRFLKNTSNTYEYNLGIKANLVYSEGLFEIHYDSGAKEYFNINNKLSQIQDIYENELNFSYDTNNLLTQVTDTLGRNIEYSYENNRLTEVKDFHNNSVEIAYYDGSSNSGSLYDIQEIILNNNENTKTISFEYDNNHNITKLIDSKEQMYVSNTYDTNKRVATQIYGTGTISYNYTLLGNQVTKNTVTDRVGNITEYMYDNSGNNTQTLYKSGSQNIIYNYAYNTAGYLISETKPLGNGVKYTYDNTGNIIEKRQKTNMSASDDNTSDIITTYTYNTKNQVLTQTLPNGVVIENTYDTDGNLISKETSNIKTSSGSHYATLNTFDYDSLGQLIESTNAKGNTTYFTYSSGMLIESKNGNGAAAILNQFTYNDYGILTNKTDGRGNTITFEVNDFNQTGTGITSEGIVKSFLYDENNNITTESHYFIGGVKQTQTVYDILDNPTQIISDYDVGKQIVSHIKYDNNGNIIEKKFGSGAVIQYSYNNFAKIVEERIIVNPSDSSKDIVTSYTYDINGNILSKTDSLGNITSYQYDGFDRVIRETSALGNYTKLYYGKDNSLAKEEKYNSGDLLLAKKEFTYNGIGKILKEISYKDPVNNSGAVVITSDYDLNGNLISQTDALGNTTTFEYDTFNRLIRSEDKLGNKIVNTYDKNHNIISKSIHQNNGKVTTTTYLYDNDNRLISETKDPESSSGGPFTKSYTYNNLNQITSIIDEQGNITEFTYDYVGNILSETKLSSSGNIVTNYTYDERGNNTSITDGEGNTTTYIYNNLNQLITTKYADNKEVNYSYDKVGNLISQTDPNGNMVNNSYDNLGRVISRNITPGSGIVGVTSESYSYDSLGRLVEANDSSNHKLEFEYDSLNRLVSETQSGSIVSYTYDDNNNLLNITNPNGKTTNYTYDELSRVIGIKLGNDTIANYSYSGLENTSIHYGNNTSLSKTFDDLMRLTTLQIPDQNFIYNYDHLGNITSDNRDKYTYDSFQRIIKVEYDFLYDNKNTGNRIQNYTYDHVGNRETLQNAKLTSKTQNVCVSQVIQETYIDNKGNTKTRNKTVKECNPETNIIEKSQNITQYTGNELNQYTNLSLQNNKGEEKRRFDFEYDANGNLIGDLEFRYSYDYKNRLIEAKSKKLKADGVTPKTIIHYAYDLQGRRILKVVNNTSFISYLYAGKNLLTQQTKNKNGVISQMRENIYGVGIDDLLSTDLTTYKTEKQIEEYLDKKGNLKTKTVNVRVPTTKKYFYHKNHLGSIISISNEAGEIIEKYAYDVFGQAFIEKELFNEQKAKINAIQSLDEISEEQENTESDENISGSEEIQIHNKTYAKYNGKGIIGNVILFTGREFDKEISLYYNRARYYSPELGRFISRDPIGQIDDVNLYAYVGNNPVMFVDLMGTDKKFIAQHDANNLLEKYKQEAVNQLSFGGYFPKFGYSTLSYPINSLGINKWNTKYNSEFQEIAFDPTNNNQSCSGYSNKGAGGCQVYVNGEKMELSEIGNYLIGYNGAYAGFTLNSKNMGNNIEDNKLKIPYFKGGGELGDVSSITTDIYEAGMRVEFQNHYSANLTYNEIIQNALNDELVDRPWYDKGYSDASQEIRKKWGFNY